MCCNVMAWTVPTHRNVYRYVRACAYGACGWGYVVQGVASAMLYMSLSVCICSTLGWSLPPLPFSMQICLTPVFPLPDELARGGRFRFLGQGFIGFEFCQASIKKRYDVSEECELHSQRLLLSPAPHEGRGIIIIALYHCRRRSHASTPRNTSKVSKRR